MKKNYRLYYLLTAILFLVSFLSACSTKKSFYRKGSGPDYLRFPLLEPYYAIKITDEYGWQIPINTDLAQRNFRYYPNILNVTKVAVENGRVMVYSAYPKPIVLDGGKEKELHWFILVPDKTETGFEAEEAFISSLQQYGVNQPQWQEPQAILKRFDQTGCLEWIPGCK